MYCREIEDLALFFQEFVFGLPEKSKSCKGATYLTVISDISKYVQFNLHFASDPLLLFYTFYTSDSVITIIHHNYY